MVHGSSQHELQEWFQQSGDTISRYLNKGLLLLRAHSTKNTSKTLLTKQWRRSSQSLSGTLSSNTAEVQLMVCMSQHLTTDILHYHDRHGDVSQNCLAACDFDMQFLYIMAGYEEAAADGLLFNCA
jgi:hypothetical protein